MIKQEKISVVHKEKISYPDFGFDPDKKFPELKNLDFDINVNKKNKIYSLVRESLYYLGLDKKNYGKKSWNPFRKFIKKGENIIIKPNLVMHKHPLGNEGVKSTITHASVIKPIIDYVLLATGGACNITICDVPLQSANWQALIKKSGLKKLVKNYSKKRVDVKLLDLRYEIAIPNKEGVYSKRIKKVRDPKGYTKIDLGKKSYIQKVIKDYKKLEITDYGSGTVSKHHNPNKNEYLVPNTILESDVFINMPKLKTHRKAGLTLSMKNLIGINGDKSWIAHHRRGVDEKSPVTCISSYLKWKISHYLKIYAPDVLTTTIFKLYRLLFRKGKDARICAMNYSKSSVMEGNWYGNDTVWRTILDLNNIIFFSNKKGKLKNKKQRKYLTIIDGIIGMEKEGPMEGIPKKCGILIGGFHPVSTDYIAAHIMGFDYRKIHKIREGFKEKYFELTKFKKEDIKVSSNVNWKKLNFKFKPAAGWKNHIER